MYAGRIVQYLGRVLNCGEKIANVNVTQMKIHPDVNMLYKLRVEYLTVDSENQCRPGDLVVIRSLRRKAGKCKFELLKVVKSTQSYVHPETGEITYQNNYKD